MNIEDALARYVTQLEADGRSRHTIHQYQRHIGLVASWLRERGSNEAIEEIDHETLATFLASPTARSRTDGKTKKATSANALRTSMRTFFRYAHEAGYCRSNPARLVRRALCGSPPPRAMSDEEQGRLLLALAAGVGPEAKRDHALFALMLGSGIRLGSALALETRDVDLKRGELALRRTKGDVPTSVPLSRAVIAHLRCYLQGRSNGPLFTGRGGRALSARHAQRRLGIWCERARLGRAVSPHALRHSFAIRIYRQTRDLLLVQAAMGHRSIASTCVYARTNDAAVRAAVGG